MLVLEALVRFDAYLGGRLVGRPRDEHDHHDKHKPLRARGMKYNAKHHSHQHRWREEQQHVHIDQVSRRVLWVSTRPRHDDGRDGGAGNGGLEYG